MRWPWPPCPGMVIAAVSMLVANRLLPGDMAGKGEWEQNVFWAAWALSFVHAALRNRAVAQAHISPAGASSVWRWRPWLSRLWA